MHVEDLSLVPCDISTPLRCTLTTSANKQCVPRTAAITIHMTRHKYIIYLSKRCLTTPTFPRATSSPCISPPMCPLSFTILVTPLPFTLASCICSVLFHELFTTICSQFFNMLFNMVFFPITTHWVRVFLISARLCCISRIWFKEIWLT